MYKPLCSLLITCTPLLALASQSQPASITLHNQNQTVQIEPQNFAIDWQQNAQLTINQGQLTVNGQPQQVSQLQQDNQHHASWLLVPSQLKVEANLQQTLKLSITASAESKISRAKPLTVQWFELPEQQSKTLILPFSEGMRIPTDNPQWVNYLIAERSASNTTQDLKMPFWSVEAGNEQYVSYQLNTATNNKLNFSAKQNKLDMQATHAFTVLNKDEPFEVEISLGNSPLDGAKRYRQWRKENGLSQTLEQKAQQNPAIKQLIGASHVYLFGQDLVSTQDVTDFWALKEWYFKQPQWVASNEALKELKPLVKGKDFFNNYNKRLLIDEVNRSLNAWIKEQPSTQEAGIASQYQAAQARKAWLAEQKLPFLRDASTWGQGLSTSMIDALSSAGLQHLWLGLDNWMPAFYQPQVVDQAKQAGYLVGVYDSYNTAIAKGINDGWLTAQLPDAMRKQCAIENADGKKQKGFRGNGFYLNPACQLGFVQQRIEAILKYGRFNSLFLDVDGTGMAREDYSYQEGQGMKESAMLEAFNQRMRWIANEQNVVLGSEDGNSLTTQGLSFAHGLETVGFGWTDPDMKTNRQSPYFLGAWFPTTSPDFFFKPAQVKEPYKTLLFAPQYRIPLYQTVFHDEVINSHHWHNDSVKFSNVQAERDLIAMLYNTPAMIHLSRDEATPNSVRVNALRRYQQGFAPIHEVVWNQPLVDFKWLDEQGMVQQTTFGDGSKITANFSTQPYKKEDKEIVPALSIQAELSNGQNLIWASDTLKTEK